MNLVFPWISKDGSETARPQRQELITPDLQIRSVMFF